MSKPDNDNGRVYHIRLNSYERQIIEKMGIDHGISPTAAFRMLVRAADIHIGFKRPDEK